MYKEFYLYFDYHTNIITSIPKMDDPAEIADEARTPSKPPPGRLLSYSDAPVPIGASFGGV